MVYNIILLCLHRTKFTVHIGQHLKSVELLDIIVKSLHVSFIYDNAIVLSMFRVSLVFLWFFI